MDQGMLIDAIVRQTTVLIAQLATAGGGRAQLSHTANQVFLDLVGALKEQGLGTKVIADMFGMALRTYQTKVQRLNESRTERGRSLWEALFAFIQEHGATRPVARGELLRHFGRDDALSVGGVLRDLVDSGLVYRSGRGDHAQYRTADAAFAPDAFSAQERAQSFVWLTVHRLAPATRDQLVDALSMDSSLVDAALSKLLEDGRIRRSEQDRERYESDGCVLPLGEPAGWEAALFDHYQAMVMAICTKLQLGRNQARASDLIGGSTFRHSWREARSGGRK